MPALSEFLHHNLRRRVTFAVDFVCHAAIPLFSLLQVQELADVLVVTTLVLVVLLFFQY